MPYVRAPGESDADWLTHHVGQETDVEWKARITLWNPFETRVDWLRRIQGRLPGEAPEDWRARVFQRFQGKEPEKVWNERKTVWTAANGHLFAAPAAAAPPAPPVPDFSGQEVMTAEIPVAADGRPKRRIKLWYQVFWPIPGVATQGDLERIIRKRTMKWVRRVYSQANLAPAIEGITFLNHPPKNMIAVCGTIRVGDTYQAANVPPSGVVKPPGAGPSRITIRFKVAGAAQPDVDIPIQAAWGTDPAQNFRQKSATAIEGAFAALGFQTQRWNVPASDPIFPESYDIYVRTAGGEAFEFISATHNDAGMHGGILETPDLSRMKFDGDDQMHGGTALQRMILRSAADPFDPLRVRPADRIDIFVLPEGMLNGRAFPEYIEIPNGPFKVGPELRRAAYVCFKVSDGVVFGDNDDAPFTLAHEIDHVLADTPHSNAEGCLMKGTYSKANSVMAEKRIYSAPLLVGSECMDSTRGPGPRQNVYRKNQDMANDMHTRGGRDPGGVTKPW